MARTLSKKQIKARRIVLGAITTIAILAIALFYIIVTESGHWLVDDDEFSHAKWVAVLDGQSADMERTDYAAKLLADKKVDSVLILGRRVFRDHSNTEFYADDFMRQGDFDSNAVFLATHDDNSTIGEAYTIIPWLKARNADTVILLTEASATHRVKRIFTSLSGDAPIYLTADIHHYQYDADSWYTNRESRKSWLREWAALAMSYIDLFSAGVLTAADSTYYRPIVSVKEFNRDKEPLVDLQSLLPQIIEPVQDSIQDSTKINEAAKDSSQAAAIQ